MDLELVEIFLQSSLPGMMDCSTTFPSPSPMEMVTQWVYRPDVSPRSATESTRGLKIKLAKMCIESESELLCVIFVTPYTGLSGNSMKVFLL